MFPFHLCTVGIEGDRFENPPDGEAQVADARLSVHSGSVRRDAVQFLHGSFLAQSTRASANCQSPSRAPQNPPTAPSPPRPRPPHLPRLWLLPSILSYVARLLTCAPLARPLG